jgi:hypothetical protein
VIPDCFLPAKPDFIYDHGCFGLEGRIAEYFFEHPVFEKHFPFKLMNVVKCHLLIPPVEVAKIVKTGFDFYYAAVAVWEMIESNPVGRIIGADVIFHTHVTGMLSHEIPFQVFIKKVALSMRSNYKPRMKVTRRRAYFKKSIAEMDLLYPAVFKQIDT